MSSQAFLDHPYHDLSGCLRLRGNLHAHTTRSDGVSAPEAVVAAYRDRGYDFLMISDHDTLGRPEWLATLDAGAMLLIPGNEITAGGPHLLHVNASTLLEPDAQRQRVLNAMTADPESFAILCHPDWQDRFDHTRFDQLQEWVGYAGIEIYNGVINRHHGSPYATNKWDRLLATGRRCWGYANDDSHRPGDLALGWNQVFVRERSVKAVVEALRNGCFYASTGVEIESILVEGRTIRLQAGNAERIAAIEATGRRFAQVDGACLEVEVPEGSRYVRFECWGRGEAMAWSQPFYVRVEKP